MKTLIANRTSKIKLGLITMALCLPCIILSMPAFANLLITPLQVTMEGRTRTAQIILVNTESESNTYRLGWEQVEQSQETGVYVDSDMESGALYLQNIAVFTPRQITLAPNEKQTIRIAVRRPADLPDGEYKSHLRFGVVAMASPLITNDNSPKKNEIGIMARINTSYSIPVVYRVGEYDININIGRPEFKRNDNTGMLMVNIFVERSGIHGVIGQIDLYHTPSGGQEVLISSLGNANIFPEISGREFTMPTQISGLQPGILRAVFQKAEGQKRDYIVLDEKTFPVGN